MKISGRKPINPATPLGSVSRSKDAAKVDTSAPADQQAADVNLSEAMREVERAREILGGLPDVRTEKIDEIKPVVDDGTYHRESRVIAKKMVDSSLRESAELRKK